MLNAAIELFRSHGFHGVGIDDIGAGAGITGPGIYRHFDNKRALLVAIFDQVLDELSAAAERILEGARDDADALAALVEFHTDFVLTNRSIFSVYHQEERNLGEPDRRRIRRRQRAYLDQWVRSLTNLDPTLDDAEANALVHAAIGVISSPTMYESRLGLERLRHMLVERALLVLCSAAAEPRSRRGS